MTTLFVDIGGVLLTNGEAGSANLIVTYPDELLTNAVAKMLQHNVGRLPVVSRDDPQHLIGYLGRSDVLQARLRQLDEELTRQPANFRLSLIGEGVKRSAQLMTPGASRHRHRIDGSGQAPKQEQ